MGISTDQDDELDKMELVLELDGDKKTSSSSEAAGASGLGSLPSGNNPARLFFKIGLIKQRMFG
jgi:hypothetical protein